MSKVIGIDARVVWLGAEDEVENQYISFGEWDEKDDEDTYGVLDGVIFYYAKPSELSELYRQDQQRGWYIKSHNERTMSNAVTNCCLIRNDTLCHRR
jgi:hypothetical protein